MPLKSIVEFSRRSLFILALIGLTLHVWTEARHNTLGLSVVQCLADVGKFRLDSDEQVQCTNQMVEFVTGALEPASNGLLNTPQSSLQTASRQGSRVQSLEVFIADDRTYKRNVGSQVVPPPITLPVYEYVLALQMTERKDWSRSLEYFERALISHPRPWPARFYDHYLEALTHVATRKLEPLGFGERATKPTSPDIKVGDKFQPQWDVPIVISGEWQLQGLAVGSWFAFDHSFPVSLELFWTAPNQATKYELKIVENMIANGGFELGTGWKMVDNIGWYPGKESDARSRISSHNGRSSTALVLSSGGTQYSPFADTNFIPIESQTNLLLWSAWIDRSRGGNPMIFVLWFDSQKKFLRFEIPFQGNVVGDSGRHYAGVIQIPQDATYLQIRLHNWQASGEAMFDNLLLFPLKPPFP